MRIRASLIALAVTSLTLVNVPARAELDSSCSIAGGSAATPHIEDPAGDQQVNLDSGVPTPDSTDLRSAWLERDDQGVVTANIGLANVSGAELSYRYYLRWDYRGNDPAIKTTRFVTAQPRPYGHVFRYGYLDTTATPQTLVTEGETTGTITSGAPGKISIVVPFASLGNPQAGDTLFNVIAQARVLIGNPGAPSPAPAPPPGTPSGVVSTVDDSTNADTCLDVTV